MPSGGPQSATLLRTPARIARPELYGVVGGSDAGTDEEVATKIESFYEIGADCVALFPMPTDRVDRMVELTSERVLPLLGSRG